MTQRKTPLRAVKSGEKPTPARKPRPKTLSKAIEDGDPYVDVLKAQRRELVRDLKGEKGPALAAMHRQVALLSKEIAALEASAPGDDPVSDAADTPDEELDTEAL